MNIKRVLTLSLLLCFPVHAAQSLKTPESRKIHQDTLLRSFKKYFPPLPDALHSQILQFYSLTWSVNRLEIYKNQLLPSYSIFDALCIYSLLQSHGASSNPISTANLILASDRFPGIFPQANSRPKVLKDLPRYHDYIENLISPTNKVTKILIVPSLLPDFPLSDHTAIINRTYYDVMLVSIVAIEDSPEQTILLMRRGRTWKFNALLRDQSNSQLQVSEDTYIYRTDDKNCATYNIINSTTIGKDYVAYCSAYMLSPITPEIPASERVVRPFKRPYITQRIHQRKMLPVFQPLPYGNQPNASSAPPLPLQIALHVAPVAPGKKPVISQSEVTLSGLPPALAKKHHESMVKLANSI